MSPEEFVRCFVVEKNSFLAEYTSSSSESAVAQDIASLALNDEQQAIMNEVIDGILTDVFYTLLLGLEGAASIGGKQVIYKLYDDEGNELTGLDVLAWTHFYGDG